MNNTGGSGVRRSRLLMISAVSVVVVLIGWGVARTYRRNQRVARFAQLVPGQSESDVIASLGRPDWVESPPRSGIGVAAKENPCVRELFYHDAFATSFGVCLDGRGQVQSTFHYVSP